MYDLLIRAGQVYDGTGSAGYSASVAVEDGRLRILRGDTSGVDAARVIDATGLAVCPGFIDTHAHSGLVMLSQPLHEAKVRQGVTTELVGVDGLSYAPFASTQDFWAFAEMNSGLDGRPPADASWSSVDEYLSGFDGKVAANVAYVMGNSPLRIGAMGWDDRPLTPDESRRMQGLLRQGMEEGAFGISTGLNYPPGSYASTDEVVALCKEVHRLGGLYVTHVRYPMGDQFLDPFREALDIGRRSGVPVHISHIASRMVSPDAAPQILALVEEAIAEGVQVTFDLYPYTYASTRLMAVVPEWAHEGGTERLRERLQDPKVRELMAQETDFQERDYEALRVTNFTRREHLAMDGHSLADIARTLKKSLVDALCDLLLEEEMGLTQVRVAGNPVNVRQFLSHSGSMVGSDALLIGEHPSPRTYGCFANILGGIVRDEGLLDLADAVRKMTSFPARTLGLKDRGLLEDGLAADVVIFDPQRVRAPGTPDVPRQFAEGVHYVIVNGQVVIDQGQHTGALPGRALRHRA